MAAGIVACPKTVVVSMVSGCVESLGVGGFFATQFQRRLHIRFDQVGFVHDARKFAAFIIDNGNAFTDKALNFAHGIPDRRIGSKA